MKITKETRQLSRGLLRASLVNGQLDKERIAALVKSLVEKKPRNYIRVLENFLRLLLLEVEKRHARIESASELSPWISSKIASSLQRKYGNELTTEFLVNKNLIGGMRIRVGSDVWDSSVRNRLQCLQQQL